MVRAKFIGQDSGLNITVCSDPKSTQVSSSTHGRKHAICLIWKDTIRMDRIWSPEFVFLPSSEKFAGVGVGVLFFCLFS